MSEPQGLRKYAYREMHIAETWDQAGTLILDSFLRYCTEQGAPSGTIHKVVGLRLNTEGARDYRGELPHRIECDANDRRAIEIELRMTWLG